MVSAGRVRFIVALCLGGTVVSGIVPARAQEKGRDAASLAFTAVNKEFRFDTGVLGGTLREGGQSLGLKPVRERTSGVSLAGALGWFSPYRLLTADARFGSAAWDWLSQAERLPDGSVMVRWQPDKDHPLEISAVYRWTSPNVLDLTITVKPRQDLRNFELFLASYFQGFPQSLVYVQENPQAGGKLGFLEARKALADWQMFPRDDQAVALINDGRWQRPPHPVGWKIMPCLAAPLALRRDPQSGLTVALMAPSADCFAISTPYGEEGHRSVYFSLFGRDVKSGQSATAKARLVVGRDISNRKAIELFRAYQR